MSTEINETEKAMLLKNDSENSLSLESIKKKLESIEEEYKNAYPSMTPDEADMPQFKPVKNPTVEEIKNEAQIALGDYVEANRSQIQEDFNNSMNAIEIKEKEVKLESELDKQELESERVVDLESNRANMIGQGLERSSIAVQTEESIDTAYNNELVALIEKTQLSLSELDLKRAITQNEMNVALEKFDIAFAAKLEKKIEELTEKYDKEMIELEKYNLKIAELRNKRNEEWRKWVDSKTSEINSRKGRAKIEYLLNSLKQMDKYEARRVIEDPEVIASLGAHYPVALDYVNRRK